MNAIEVRDLRKRFGATVAVDGVTFSIPAGEAFGLLGPNGAGKTTTIRMIVGALKPDAGSVTVEGEPDPTRERVRLRIGAVPQSIALYADLTAEENLRFFGALYGMSGARLDERVRWALGFSGLEPRRRDRVSSYSGGMQRRLNLVAGLLHDPPVILMDEPTAGVDPQSRNHIFENIEALKRQGRSILYTTHYMEEAERLCDRVAIIDRGLVRAVDSVEGLLGRYGGEPVSRVERGTLETVFLHLTGRQLRD